MNYKCQEKKKKKITKLDFIKSKNFDLQKTLLG